MAVLTALALLQDQWMAQKLVNGILIQEDPLAPHPGVFLSDSLLRGLGVGIKLHDYLGVILRHG